MNGISFAAGALVTIPEGMVLVSEKDKTNHTLKIPGGRWRPQDGNQGPRKSIALRIVMRKVLHETGMCIPLHSFTFKGIQLRKVGTPDEHEYYFFVATATESEGNMRYRVRTNNFTVHVFDGEKLFKERRRLPKEQVNLLTRYNLW